MECHICGSTNPVHMRGYASGRADIAHGGGMEGSEAIARARQTRKDLPSTSRAIASAAAHDGPVRERVEDEGTWWVGYYHGRRAEHLNLVGVLDIAERAGVTRDAVQKWRNRYPDFPAIEATISDYPVWRWAEVEAWLRATGRLDSGE